MHALIELLEGDVLAPRLRLSRSAYGDTKMAVSRVTTKHLEMCIPTFTRWIISMNLLTQATGEQYVNEGSVPSVHTSVVSWGKYHRYGRCLWDGGCQFILQCDGMLL
jgi:hypothetical protein